MSGWGPRDRGPRDRGPGVEEPSLPPVATPRTLYVHDDLSADVAQRFGEDSAAFRLTHGLFGLVSDPPRTSVLTLDEQVAGLMSQGSHAPFAMTVGIGRAGESVARKVQGRAGWFPTIRRVDVTRVEDGRGGYTLVSTATVPVEAQLLGLEAFPSLAVVDDTIFSGLTMGSVLRALPPGALTRTHAFCLRCVAETLPSVSALCPVSAGFAAQGRIDDDVSFINASGLVTRVGISPNPPKDGV